MTSSQLLKYFFNNIQTIHHLERGPSNNEEDKKSRKIFVVSIWSRVFIRHPKIEFIYLNL
jgi:hypothetical protein